MLLRKANDRLVNLNHNHLGHSPMLEDVSQDATVTCADDKHATSSAMLH